MADQTTAEALAANPRCEWREGMLVGPGRAMEGWRFCHRDDLGFYFSRQSRIYVLTDTQMRLAVARPVPDLDDDATAGVVLGMVREWCDERGSAVEVFCGTQHSSVHAGLVGGYGSTLGEAAGGCLLSCWEYDAADGGPR